MIVCWVCLNYGSGCLNYVWMFGAWPLSSYWLLDVYGTIFVQVRRVGEGNRNLKKVWLLAGVRLAVPPPTVRQCNLHAPGAVAWQDRAAALMFQRFQYRGSDPEARKKWRDNIKLPRQAPRRDNIGQTRLFLIHQLKSYHER
jgi:hypothetical protein